MMAEPLLSFDISKRRRGNRSALPPRPPNAWILYRSDKMREIQRERKSSMLLNNKPKSLSSSSSTNNVNFDYPSVQAGNFIKEDSILSTQGSSSKESIKSLSPKDIDRLDENAGGANCLQAQISRMVSQMWKNEDEQVKQHYAKLAAEHKLEHQRQYPNYRYQPKRRSRLSLPTHNSHTLPTDFRRIEAQHPDGHYDSNRGTSKRDWHTASWPSWQYPWNTPQGHNPYDSTLSLQQMGYGSNSRPTFRTGNNPHDKRSQSDGIYNHPLMPQSEQQRYTPVPTTNGMPSPALLPPTTQSGRSMVQVSMQPQHYPIQPAYVQSAQVQINTQVPESNRTYSDNLAASIPLPQQTITTSTYSSDPTMFSHSQPNSQIYENNLRRISPSQSSSSNAYTSISPDAHQQHLQLHPTNNQRSQQMPEMDMLQNLLATGNTTAYNGSPAFAK